jgi:hypothetical protein
MLNFLPKAGDEVRVRFNRPLDFDQSGGERRLGCGELLIGIRKARVDRRAGGSMKVSDDSVL